MNKYHIYAFLPVDPQKNSFRKEREEEKREEEKREASYPSQGYIAVVPQSLVEDELFVPYSHSHTNKDLPNYHMVDLGTCLEPWKKIDPGCLYYDPEYGIVWISIYELSQTKTRQTHKDTYLSETKILNFPKSRSTRR